MILTKIFICTLADANLHRRHITGDLWGSNTEPTISSIDLRGETIEPTSSVWGANPAMDTGSSSPRVWYGVSAKGSSGLYADLDISAECSLQPKWTTNAERNEAIAEFNRKTNMFDSFMSVFNFGTSLVGMNNPVTSAFMGLVSSVGADKSVYQQNNLVSYYGNPAEPMRDAQVEELQKATQCLWKTTETMYTALDNRIDPLEQGLEASQLRELQAKLDELQRVEEKIDSITRNALDCAHRTSTGLGLPKSNDNHCSCSGAFGDASQLNPDYGLCDEAIDPSTGGIRDPTKMYKCFSVHRNPGVLTEVYLDYRRHFDLYEGSASTFFSNYLDKDSQIITSGPRQLLRSQHLVAAIAGVVTQARLVPDALAMWGARCGSAPETRSSFDFANAQKRVNVLRTKMEYLFVSSGQEVLQQLNSQRQDRMTSPQWRTVIDKMSSIPDAVTPATGGSDGESRTKNLGVNPYREYTSRGECHAEHESHTRFPFFALHGTPPPCNSQCRCQVGTNLPVVPAGEIQSLRRRLESSSSAGPGVWDAFPTAAGTSSAPGPWAAFGSNVNSEKEQVQGRQGHQTPRPTPAPVPVNWSTPPRLQKIMTCPADSTAVAQRNMLGCVVSPGSSCSDATSEFCPRPFETRRQCKCICPPGRSGCPCRNCQSDPLRRSLRGPSMWDLDAADAGEVSARQGHRATGRCECTNVPRWAPSHRYNLVQSFHQWSMNAATSLPVYTDPLLVQVAILEAAVAPPTAGVSTPVPATPAPTPTPTPTPVRIKMKNGNKCLDAPGWDRRNGGLVYMYNCLDASDPSLVNQQWRYDATTLQIKSGGGYCLDASERNKNGGRVHMWDCDTRNLNQQWDYDSRTGQVKVRHGKCLDTPWLGWWGWVQMFDCDTNNSNQQWDITASP